MNRLPLRLVKVKFKDPWSNGWAIGIYNPNKLDESGNDIQAHGYPVELLCSDEIYRMSEIEELAEFTSLADVQEVAATYEE